MHICFYCPYQGRGERIERRVLKNPVSSPQRTVVVSLAAFKKRCGSVYSTYFEVVQWCCETLSCTCSLFWLLSFICFLPLERVAVVAIQLLLSTDTLFIHFSRADGETGLHLSLSLSNRLIELQLTDKSDNLYHCFCTFHKCLLISAIFVNYKNKTFFLVFPFSWTTLRPGTSIKNSVKK